MLGKQCVQPLLIIFGSCVAHIERLYALPNLEIITPALAWLPLQRLSISRNKFLPGTQFTSPGSSVANVD